MLGLFYDYNLVSIALYTFGILLAKLQCVLGIKTSKRTFKQRNRLTAFFLMLSSLLYIVYMAGMFFWERRLRHKGMSYVLLLAFVSFWELGFAIAGLFRTKNRGHYYRNIKIINLCVALIAILTTQMAILNMQSDTDIVSIFNAYTGIGIGCFVALCAIYILVAPKTSVIGREHHRFVLQQPQLNGLATPKSGNWQLPLCRSAMFGDYLFAATVENNAVEGDIVRGKSLWVRMPLLCKILCCILSEILVFVWIAGRGVLFLRSINLPGKLERTMLRNGFVPAQLACPSTD